MSLEIVATAISVLTFAGGTIAWYSAFVQKRYAAQRDFEHLKRNFEQNSQALKVLREDLQDLSKVLDSRFDSLDRNADEIRNKLNVILIKILPEQSTGWMNQRGKD